MADACALLTGLARCPRRSPVLPKVGSGDVHGLRPYAEAVWASA